MTLDYKDVWQQAYDEAIAAGEIESCACTAADEAVADWSAMRADEIYDHWRDREVPE